MEVAVENAARRCVWAQVGTGRILLLDRSARSGGRVTGRTLCPYSLAFNSPRMGADFGTKRSVIRRACPAPNCLIYEYHFCVRPSLRRSPPPAPRILTNGSVIDRGTASVPTVDRRVSRKGAPDVDATVHTYERRTRWARAVVTHCAFILASYSIVFHTIFYSDQGHTMVYLPFLERVRDPRARALHGPGGVKFSATRQCVFGMWHGLCAGSVRRRRLLEAALGGQIALIVHQRSISKGGA